MATAFKHQHDDDIYELNETEAKEVFESAVRKRLKISTEEFLRKLDADQFKDMQEDPTIMRLISLLPLVR